MPYWFGTPCFALAFLLRVSGFPKSSLRWFLSKGAILFCDYRLLQRTWLLGLFSPCTIFVFRRICAPLLRFGSLQCLGYQEPVFPRFSLPGTVHSCAFSSLQWFALPYTSRVYFTPIHSWDFPSELSPLRDWFLLSKRFLALRRSVPFYCWLLRAPDARLPSYPG